MKVLFVMNSGFDIQGPSNHLFESIIEKLLQEGVLVHLIEKNSGGDNPSVPNSLRKYKSFTYDVIKVKSIKKNNLIRRYLSDIKYSLSCIKFYKKHKDCDAVFLQSSNMAIFFVFFLKQILKKPIIFNVQDIFPKNASMIGLLEENSFIYKFLNFLQNAAYKRADKIITISEDMKQTLINEKISSDKIDVIYNWSYSDNVIEILDINNRFLIENHIYDNRFKVVYAGNIGTMQNIEVILEAAKYLLKEKQIIFYIIGNGVKKEYVIDIAKKNKLENIKFFPMQPPEIAQDIYGIANINLIPLKKGVIHTALPSKTAACLACGKPIIACIDLDSKFARLISNLDNCKVVDSNDPIGLAKEIKSIYEEKVKRSEGARLLFHNYFSKTKNVNKYISIIKQHIK